MWPIHPGKVFPPIAAVALLLILGFDMEFDAAMTTLLLSFGIFCSYLVFFKQPPERFDSPDRRYRGR